MKLSDLIEEYIREVIADNDTVELKRSDLSRQFNCVPSQINYVISTRFIPELGFYVESRRGGGGYIRISRVDLDSSSYISEIIDKIGDKLSQSVADIYLNELIRYNVLDKKIADIMRTAISDKSLSNADTIKRDYIRADIFKNMIIKVI